MKRERLPDGLLTPSRTAVLAAATQTVLPHLTAEQADCLVTALQVRIARSPAAIGKDLALALDVLGSRAAGFLVSGRLRSFVSLSGEDRATAFERWARSRLAPARTVHQAIRKLITSTWYALDDGRRELGVLPPLHTRLPHHSWEGPLPGPQTLDSEPVARQPASARSVPQAPPAAPDVPAGVVTPGTLRGDRRIRADVVVVGSGAGGAVAACRFAEAGREVVILEEGEYLHAPDFTGDEASLMPRLFADQGMRTTTDASITLLQGGAVGGGSTVNWMLMLRPPPSVLDDWSRIAGIGGGDLTPHLERIESEVHARMPPDDAHSPSNSAILTGARSLGWRARPAMINARGCVQAGSCTLGCRYDAKQSVHLTYLPRAFAAGARLYSGASVAKIDVIGPRWGGGMPDKRVEAVVRDPGGAVCGSLTVEAPVVVLASGAVGTPVILQRSGLGGGGVGRYLRLHPTTAVMGHYDRETYPLAGIPQTSLCDEFLERDEHGYGYWIECPGLLPALAAASMPGFGEGHRALIHQLRSTVAFIVLVRDGSGSDRSMGSVSLDRRGRTRIRHRLTRHDRANLRHGIEAAARLHLAAGATEAVSLHTPPVTVTGEPGLAALRAAPVAPNRVGLFSAHINGTCRLGLDPATSGCSPTGERHGVRGLYVMDGSLLPTAPGVNPQATIMALASLLAERAAG